MQLESLVVPISLDTGLFLKSVEIVIGALTGGIQAVDDWGNSLDTIQDSLGGTSKQAAGLALASKKVGLPVEQTTALFNKFAKSLEDAKGGLGTSGKLLESMGITIQDTNGKIRPFEELIGEVSTKINQMPDGLDKTNIEMTLFGRSGAAAGDLMAQLANGGMQQVMDQAEKMGLVIDPAAVKAYDAQWATLQATIQGIQVQIGNSLLPTLMDVTTQMIALAEAGKASFEQFRQASQSETSAIGTAWKTLLDQISVSMDLTFGVKGLNLVINWSQIGVTALQYIDIMIVAVTNTLAAFTAGIVYIRQQLEGLAIAAQNALSVIGAVTGVGVGKGTTGVTGSAKIIGKKASGGFASGLTWVGEKSAELLDLPTGTTVYNNQASGAMGFDYYKFASILAVEFAKARD